MKYELLAPAGNLEIFYAVINAGANAVYIGGPKFGARAYAKNFSEEEIIEAIIYAHLHDVKVYMTVNTLVKEDEMDDCIQMMIPFYEVGLDGVIIQDIGVLSSFRRHFPNMELHCSTQMSISDVEGAKLLKNLGAVRIVPSRELSLNEIKKIHDEADIEIESFVHGALCYCYSGQCLLSSVIGGRSGNRGRCAQPCRLPYEVLNESMKKVPATSSILSLKDLCTIEFLPELLEAGVFSLKIEGRMKQASYAYTVVSIYRKYLDLYEKYGRDKYKVSKADLQALLDAGNRNGFTDGYYHKRNSKDMVTADGSAHNSSAGELDEKTICDPRKIAITGTAVFLKNEPARLFVTYNDKTVDVTGPRVEAAQTAGMGEEKILKQLNKTGTSKFSFSDLTITMDDDIFIPVSELNKMRRDALALLEESLVKHRKYDFSETIKTPTTSKKSEGIACLVRTKEQADVLIKKDYITRIYVELFSFTEIVWKTIPNLIRSIKEQGKECYIALPFVVRDYNKPLMILRLNELKGCIDGVLARSFDGLGFALSNGFNVITDQSLYTYSESAHNEFSKMGVFSDTIPYELSQGEIKKRAEYGGELIVYGRMPVMISAGCVHKNTLKCDKISQTTYLKDRKGYIFPIINECNGCYNIIYNSSPNCLFTKATTLPCNFLRLNFTTEDSKDVADIMQLFEKNVLSKQVEARQLDDFTWGHFKRGVE